MECGVLCPALHFTLSQNFQCAAPIGTKCTLQNDVQQLHAFDLAGTAQRTCIHGAQAAIGHKLGNLCLGIGIIASDEDIQFLASHFTGNQCACVGGIEGLDHFRARGNRFGKVFCRGGIGGSSEAIVRGVQRVGSWLWGVDEK